MLIFKYKIEKVIIMTNVNLKLFMLRQKKCGNPLRDEFGEIIYYNNKILAKANRINNQVVSYGIHHKKFRDGYILG